MDKGQILEPKKNKKNIFLLKGGPGGQAISALLFSSCQQKQGNEEGHLGCGQRPL
jgi:hypothetical protein